MNNHELTITEHLNGARLDAAIASLYPKISRAKIQKLISDGHVTINACTITLKKHLVQTDDQVILNLPQQETVHDKPQNISLDIVYEDQYLVVINKPSGLIVHPGAGAPDQTLLNAILFKYPLNRTLPQAGLIHRLDKDTTGLLLIAKDENTYYKLNHAMANREIKREYLALVKGVVIQGGTINEPLARHPKFRQRYCVNPNGKTAVTHYSVSERFQHHTLLRVKLETGRTHQIRVHMLYINHPIVGDNTYNRSRMIKQNTLSAETSKKLYSFNRQALHATALVFKHPVEEKTIELSTPLPSDFSEIIQCLNLDSKSKSNSSI